MTFTNTIFNLKLYITFVIITFSCSVVSDVKFSYYPGENKSVGIIKLLLSNEITTKDADDVSEFISIISQKSENPPAVTVHLDSVGGSISAAIKLGNLLRKHEAFAAVYDGANCYSSCVYILAGASFRAVDGRVGIHRPYEPNDNVITHAEQKIKYKKLGSQIISYLNKMNIPENLYTDSLFISPERVKILTFKELQTYGLNVNDPYAEEARSTNEAKRLGISRIEYLARKSKANSICGMNLLTNNSPVDEVTKSFSCESDVLKGIR